MIVVNIFLRYFTMVGSESTGTKRYYSFFNGLYALCGIKN